MHHRTLVDRTWYRVAKSMVRIWAAVMFRARYSGERNVPRHGGVLVVSNHQSHLDAPLVGVGFPRLMVFMARRTLFRFRPFGWLIGSLGAIPIDREGFALSGIRATIEWLRRGEPLLVFPEGTRSRDGNLGVFKPGLSLVARRAKVPILPAAIEGAYQAWPRAARSRSRDPSTCTTAGLFRLLKSPPATTSNWRTSWNCASASASSCCASGRSLPAAADSARLRARAGAGLPKFCIRRSLFERRIKRKGPQFCIRRSLFRIRYSFSLTPARGGRGGRPCGARPGRSSRLPRSGNRTSRRPRNPRRCGRRSRRPGAAGSPRRPSP